jgi:hypothetical protein
LIDEVDNMPGALPLLSFALSELYLKYLRRQWDAQNRGVAIDRALTQADYQDLGGVIQSLTQKADEEYESLVGKDPAYAQIIRHVMLRMIAIGGGELVRRRVPVEELRYSAEKNDLAEQVIKRFIEARLLVKGKDAEGNSYVEPAHNALVRGWKRFLSWVEEEKNLRLQRRLTPAAIEWKSQQQARFLWNADPYLSVLEEVNSSQTNNWLNQLEIEFVQQSIKQKHKNTRLRWGTGITVLLVVTAFVASAATFMWTIWSNLANKPNVIFTSPEQKISGTTDYRYLYTPNTARGYSSVFNQIVMGFSEDRGSKTTGIPDCIDVGQLFDQGEKSESGSNFTFTAPKEPGVYYVRFRSALEYTCEGNTTDSQGKVHNSAVDSWRSGEYTLPEQSDIGIVIVGSVFNFPLEVWQAYSNNVSIQNTVPGDENFNGEVYVVLRNFRFNK